MILAIRLHRAIGVLIRTALVSATLALIALSFFSARASSPDANGTAASAPSSRTAKSDLDSAVVSHIRGQVVGKDGNSVRTFWLNGERINNAKGKFEVTFSHSGRERLVFAAKGFASTVRTFDVQAGVDISLEKVVLTKGQTLRGRVLDAVTHAPVANALIDVDENPMELNARYEEAHLSEDWGAVRSRSDGKFTLHIEESVPTLIVTHEHYLQRWLPIRSQQSEIVVELDPGAKLKGIANRDLEGAEVRLVREDGGVSRVGLIARGVYKLFGIPPGSYFLTVWDVCAPRPRHPLVGPDRLEIPEHDTVTYNLHRSPAECRE